MNGDVVRHVSGKARIAGGPPSTGGTRPSDHKRLVTVLTDVAHELNRSLRGRTTDRRKVIRNEDDLAPVSHRHPSAPVSIVADDTSWDTGRDGEVRDIVPHDRVGADDRATTDAYSGHDHDVLPEPRTITDLDRCNPGNALIEHGYSDVFVCMHVVCDVDIPREQHAPAQANP